MECNIGANQGKCNCTYEPCVRKGKRCECITYHMKFRDLPACAFSDADERSFDRSFARFVDAYNAGRGPA